MSTSVSHLLRPATGGDLLTALPNEVTSAVQYGYTTPLEGFTASSTVEAGLEAVHRLYSPNGHDFTWATLDSDLYSEAVSQGYRDQEINFYAAAAPISGCTRPAYSFQRNGVHRIAVSRAEQAALESDGWSHLGTAFHVPDPAVAVPPTPVDTTFSFAVMPDTQNEVGNYDVRMQKRVSWLTENRTAQDLRWVLHSGDLQSWDTPDHYQYQNNSQRLTPLAEAGLPFIGAAGNHDTGAVCPGGSACPGANTQVTVRDTTTWNAFYPPDRFGLEDVYEAGKSENGFRTFQAGGLNWMVLNLELWARPQVIEWAKGVVATHPQHNVIVLTHAFLEGDGRLSTSNGGYGATAPSTLWAALDDYPNVVMTFSGHVGAATETNLSAVDGHRTAAFLQALHAPDNPVRIVHVDTANGTVSSEVRANYDPTLPSDQRDVDRVYTQYAATVTGMRWVR
jgi:hypothetical protein